MERGGRPWRCCRAAEGRRRGCQTLVESRGRAEDTKEEVKRQPGQQGPEGWQQ